MSEKEPPRRRRKVAAQPEEPRQETAASFSGRTESPVRELEDLYADTRSRLCDMFELPEEFKTHLRNARREVLLAVRSLIDARIECMDKAESRQEATRRTRVEIE